MKIGDLHIFYDPTNPPSFVIYALTCSHIHHPLISASTNTKLFKMWPSSLPWEANSKITLPEGINHAKTQIKQSDTWNVDPSGLKRPILAPSPQNISLGSAHYKKKFKISQIKSLFFARKGMPNTASNAFVGMAKACTAKVNVCYTGHRFPVSFTTDNAIQIILASLQMEWKNGVIEPPHR